MLPLEISVQTCHNPKGITYFTRLRLEFSHLRYQNFKHGFLDALDLFCSFSTAVEINFHYFFHCLNFSGARSTFLKGIASIHRSIIDKDEMKVIRTFLYGNSTYSVNNNKLILEYILETKRFDAPIF